jgi:hypothetical protein
MLSDFDLAKQSDSVAQPTAITRPASDPNGVSFDLSFFFLGLPIGWIVC